jgi:hypothetical protein
LKTADEDIEEVWTIKGGIYREVLFKIFRFYQTFDFYSFDFPEMEKGDFTEQLLVKIREDVGEQIIEDVEYRRDYIKWKEGEEKKREKVKIEKLLKRKETSSTSLSNSSLPIPSPSFSFLSTSLSTSSSL